MKYDLNRPWLTLDDWQKDYIASEGNCFLLTGRQSGKTTAMSIKIAECAVKEKEAGDYLVIAFTERQAYHLFFKVLVYLEAKYPHMIKKGSDKPTKHEITLKNGITIMCYAAGLTGTGLKGFTLKKLFIDEAASMDEEIFVVVTPMLSVTGGTIDISSTPKGREGYFYKCSLREDFKKFYVSAEDCPRHKKEFLEQERQTMTKLQFAQEYLAQFLDEIKQFFPTELIKSCMKLQRGSSLFSSLGDNFLGVDVARMGEDESVLFSVARINRENLKQIDMEITEKTLLTETALRIKNADKKYRYKKIYIDSSGVGAGCFDILLEDNQTKRKVVPIENARKSLDRDDKHQTKLMKEDLYANALRLMEQGKIELFDEPEIALSLKSVQYEYDKGNLKIFGNDTHIAEAFGRALWCMQDKTLNIWCAT